MSASDQTSVRLIRTKKKIKGGNPSQSQEIRTTGLPLLATTWKQHRWQWFLSQWGPCGGTATTKTPLPVWPAEVSSGLTHHRLQWVITSKETDRRLHFLIGNLFTLGLPLQSAEYLSFSVLVNWFMESKGWQNHVQGWFKIESRYVKNIMQCWHTQ